MLKQLKNKLLSLSLVATFFIGASGSAFVANAQDGDLQRMQTNANIAQTASQQGDASTMEIDLVRIPLPVDFEDQTIDWDNVFLGFEGAFVDVIANPDQNADNDSEYVGRMVKNAQIYWAGAFFWTEETFWFNEENNTITMDVWSPRRNVGINLKLEQSDGSGEFDSFAITSKDGEWETMTWSYSGVNQ